MKAADRAKRNRAIVADRVVRQMSYAAIGRKHGLSHEGVRKVLEQAMLTGRLDYHETRECAVCGARFRVLRSRRRLACSRACAQKLGGISRRGGPTSEHETVTRTCERCGEEYQRTRKYESYWRDKGFKRTFCSRACYIATLQES